MNQTKYLFIFSVVMLCTLMSSACTSQSVPLVASDSTAYPQPVDTTYPQPMDTTYPQPIVSTSLPAAESTPLSTVQTATNMPTEPSTNGQRSVTLEDNGKTIGLTVGESFLLNLGDGYTWDISISDESVISREKNITVIKGAQGIYNAFKPGMATLTAIGDPLCRQSKPACAIPSILFKVTIEVK